MKKEKGKHLVGKVASVGGTKTIIVVVDHFVTHPLYKKSIRRDRRYAVHNESLQLAVGDRVSIAEVRPMSRTKRFTVISKL